MMRDAEAHFRKLERMYLGAPTNEYYKPGIKVSEGKAEITVAVRKDFFHAAGAVHGSVYFKLLDDAAFFAANSLVPDVFVLTASFSLKLLRPVTSGKLIGSGRVTGRDGPRIAAKAVLRDEGGKVVAKGSGEFVESRLPLGPSIGYA